MRKHGPLICLILLFILPVLGAAGALAYRKYHTIPTLQHGNFVQPPQTMTLSDQHTISGDVADNKWQIVHLHADAQNIDPDAQHMLQQLHIALGAARDRVVILDAGTQTQDFPAGSIVILNPQQMCIMHYQDLTDYSGLLKDLRRLLKYSHV